MAGTLPAWLTVSSPSRAGLFERQVRPVRWQGMDSKMMMAKILDTVTRFCGAQFRNDEITLKSTRTE